MVVLAGVVAGGGYLAVNHLASSVHRIPGIAALDAADQPVLPAVYRHSTNVLLTGDATLARVRGGGGPDHSSPVPQAQSGLVAIAHLNASGRAGAVVNLPPNVVVSVPGHGRMQLWDTLALGGASLLIRTVEHLTDVRINDYSVVDFNGVKSVIQAMGGVTVDVPFNMIGDGISFPQGINHLSTKDVLAYVRQGDVSEIGREEPQSGLIRTVLDKIAQRRFFGPVTTDYRVLHALARACSVDSNMADAQLESLALRLRYLRGADGTFVTAPTTGSARTGGTAPVYLRHAITALLWRALRHDAVAAFARRHPSAVTPGAPA